MASLPMALVLVPMALVSVPMHLGHRELAFRASARSPVGVARPHCVEAGEAGVEAVAVVDFALPPLAGMQLLLLLLLAAALVALQLGRCGTVRRRRLRAHGSVGPRSSCLSRTDRRTTSDRVLCTSLHPAPRSSHSHATACTPCTTNGQASSR